MTEKVEVFRNILFCKVLEYRAKTTKNVLLSQYFWSSLFVKELICSEAVGLHSATGLHSEYTLQSASRDTLGKIN